MPDNQLRAQNEALQKELTELEARHLKLLEERGICASMYIIVKDKYGLDDWELFYRGFQNRFN
jgi:hypothetical protein